MSYMKQLFDSKDGYIDDLESLIKYRHAYDIFMEYFDKLPEEDKTKVHKRLQGLGL
jgi:DNA-binding transcriptional regulator LsrR (DeoR family)